MTNEDPDHQLTKIRRPGVRIQAVSRGINEDPIEGRVLGGKVAR